MRTPLSLKRANNLKQICRYGQALFALYYHYLYTLIGVAGEPLPQKNFPAHKRIAPSLCALILDCPNAYAHIMPYPPFSSPDGWVSQTLPGAGAAPAPQATIGLFAPGFLEQACTTNS